MRSLSTAVAVGLAGILSLPLLAMAGLGGRSTCAVPTDTTISPTSTPTTMTPVAASAPSNHSRSTRTPTGHPSWDGEQRANARTIVQVGLDEHVPAAGWMIAVASANTVSHLHDRPAAGIQGASASASTHGENSDITAPETGQNGGGLFGFPPPSDGATPTSASQQAAHFYRTLQTVPDWQTLTPTLAALAVLPSTNPTAFAHSYRQTGSLVTQIGAQLHLNSHDLASITASQPSCAADAGDGLPTTGSTGLPAGYSLPPATPEPVAAAIGWALHQLGGRYSYGGDCTDPQGQDPAHRCDCSSLTEMAYRAGGIDLPRTTGEQAHAGTSVSDTADLQPGDLVFIPGSDGTASSPGHVGLYIGSGLILNAPHTGTDIQLAPVSQWASQIVAVRRIVT